MSSLFFAVISFSIYEERGLKIIREKDNVNINTKISIMRFLRFDNTAVSHYSKRNGIIIGRLKTKKLFRHASNHPCGSLQSRVRIGTSIPPTALPKITIKTITRFCKVNVCSANAAPL